MKRSAVLVALLAFTAGPLARQATFDLVIRNARIVDGTGAPWYRGDIGIRGDTIVAMAAALDPGGARTIDAAGQVVAPGFIDIHTHARRGIFEVPTADNYIRQGVTTLIEGPDGSSPVPLGPFLAKLDALAKSVNIGSFIGQGSIRSEVIGNVDRKATAEEIAKMQALVERGMRDGAFGLSTGLFYVPGSFTPTEEVIELAKTAARFGGMHKSHQREESVKLLDSVRETIAIGEGGGLPTQITHHKVIGKAYWGGSKDTLRLIDEARSPWRRRHQRSVSLHRIEHERRLGPAAGVGARRGPRRAERSTEGSRRPKEGPRGHDHGHSGCARWRRSKERPVCELRLRSHPGREDAR